MVQGKSSPLTYCHILYLLRRICPHGGGIQIDRDGNGAGSCALSKSFLHRFFWCFMVSFWRKLGVNVKSKCFIRWYDTNQIELTTMKTLGDAGLSDPSGRSRRRTGDILSEQGVLSTRRSESFGFRGRVRWLGGREGRVLY